MSTSLQQAQDVGAPPGFPLSSVQQVIWLDQVLQPQLPNYNVGVTLAIAGELDVERLSQAVAATAAAHDALRLVLQSNGGVAGQSVLATSAVGLQRFDFSAHADAEARADQHCRQVSATSFPLYGQPLWSAQLLRVRVDRHCLLLQCHHLVADGVAVALLCHAIVDNYNRLGTGTADVPEAGPSYLDFLADDNDYLASTRYQRDRQFWLERFARLPPALLPVPAPGGVPRPGGQLRLAITRPRFDRLVAYAEAQGCSVPHFMLALLAAYFARVNDVGQLVIGVPVHNRGNARQKQTLGMFSSIIPLAIAVEPDRSFAALMRGVAAELRRCYRHQRFPIADLNRALRLAQSGRTQLFDLTLASEAFPGDFDIDGCEVRVNKLHHGFEQTPLAVCVCDYHAGSEVEIEFNYNTGFFTGAEVAAIRQRMDLLLDSVLEGGEQPVAELSLMDEGERRRVLLEWNDTAQAYPADQAIHQLFEAQVARTPNAIALVCEGEQLSYAELNARANRLAHALRQAGVGPDRLVGLCVERSVAMVVGLLATLKAGGAYVPLDPDYPAERLRHMLQDSAPVLVLVDRVGGEALATAGAEGARTWHLQADAANWAGQSAGNLPAVSPGQLAYVIYTSGSTGRPKGVMNEHGAVVNRLLWMQQAYALDGQDVVLQKTPFSFDVSVWEFFWPLLAGARLVMARPEGHKDPAYLAGLIRQAGVTTLHFVPSMLQVFLGQGAAEGCDSLKRIFCSGEALPAALARQCLARLPQAELHNLYGPTEAAVDVTAWACRADDRRTAVPIGRPIANTRIYILDSRLQPVPVGVAGELYIGGVQVARGYLNQPELTAARFIDDPFAGKGRLYQSGDQARWLSDGSIEYLGRNDFQVKLRGLRIELGEIEACLAQVEGVREAVVLAREDVPGDMRLVAYYSGEAQSAEALRQVLGGALPAYMVPAAFVHLAALPLSPNGKLDRKALPAPQGDAYGAREFEAPQGDTEQLLAAIWAELLKIEQVGRHDNFFELGGHSLLAISLIERMRQAGLHTDVRSLFGAPTLARLAAQLSETSLEVAVPPNLIPAGAERITPEMLTLVSLDQDAIDALVATVAGGAANMQDIYPLAPLQEGILFHHLMEQAGDPYVLPCLLAFDGKARLDGFLAALQAVIDRHDILRTGIAWQGLAQPLQVVHRRAELPLTWLELDSAQGDIGLQLETRFDPCRYRLDVGKAPLLSCHAARDGERWLLRILFHHLAFDHTTLERVLAETQAIALGQQLPPAGSFRDLVAQASLGLSRQAHEAFFQEMLGDIDAPTAPFDLLDVQGDGSAIAEAQRTLPLDLAREIRGQARRQGVSVASLMHLAWALVLARCTGRRDVVFGTVLFGRMQGGARADQVLGLFINTLPLRVEVAGQPLAATLKHTHAALAQLLRHEHAPLVLAQRCSAVPAGTPLFTSLLNYRYSAQAQAPDMGEGIAFLSGHERTNYPLALAIDDLGEGFALTAQVSDRIDPQRICDLMETALHGLVLALRDTPQLAVQAIDVLPERERVQVLESWNDTAADYSREHCVHQLFEAQVARTPDAVAVEYGRKQLGYRELNARANRLAHYLRAQGAGPDSLVALAVERGLDMLVGLLGILKAGAAYVPLDPSYPAERLAHMLADAQPLRLLTQAALLADLPESEVPVLLLDEQWQAIAAYPDSDPDHAGHDPRQLAYVIYTSGSTGQPKGVMVEHGNVVNLWAGLERAIHKQHRAERISLNASIAFDAAVQQWLQLLSGRTLVIVPAWVRLDGAALGEFVAASRLDGFDCTPSQLALHEAATPALTLVGGEAIGAALWRTLADSPGKTYYNVYGPTECTVDSTIAPITASAAVPHIGRPIANARLYLLDGQGRPVPLGVAGEIHIGGSGVARGYLNQPELTAARFIADPFAAGGGRMYKTGDLGRWLPDGTVEYLGRNDFQVKIRGFRIELGEIEACLARIEGVGEVTVLARDDVPGDTRLVAYFTAAYPLSVELLRHRLGGQLPHHMVPAAFVQLAVLPLTPNGKLDRQALPAPESAAYGARDYVAPQGESETALAAIWMGLLKLDRVGRHDNFFELGGHSLLAVQLLSRLRQALDVELPLAELFDYPQLARLAERLDGMAAATHHAIRRIERNGPLPLSLAQLRLWFLSRMDGAEAYHISGAVRLSGELDRAVLGRALQTIVARHEPLRTCFQLVDGQPMQVPLASVATVLQQHDLRGHNADAWRAFSETLSKEPFDLGKEAPLRVVLLRLRDEEYVLQLIVHHIAADGWSLAVLLDELSRLYAAYLHGRPDPLAPLPIQYADYAAWQRDWLAEGQDQAAFWRANLAGAPALLELPADRPRPARQDHAGAAIAVKLDAQLSRGLKTLGQRHGVTLYMTLLASWGALLGRLASQEAVVIGSPVAGRNRAEIEPLIGFFVNTLALRIDLQDEPTVAELLKRTKAQVLAAQAHQDLPFDQVVEALKPPRSLAHTPLFQVMLDWHNTPPAELVMPGLRLTPLVLPQHTAQFDLTLSLQESADGSGIVGSLNYATALFEQATAQRYLDYWTTLLAAMVADDRMVPARLPLLSAAEHQVLRQWNDTARDYPSDACVHRLFEQQVDATPAAIAVDDGEHRLSYAELNRQANRLAHRLCRLGVGPDARVALCTERGAPMLVALLAILKAGGAYVPLDPAYPAERIAYMLADSAPLAVLCAASTRALVAPHVAAGVPVLDLDGGDWCGQPDHNPRVEGLSARHLAYVIYTSGSTGRPKGVMIEHRGLVNYTLDAIGWFGLAAGETVLQQNSLNFDLSIEEIMPALLAGATLLPSNVPFGLAETALAPGMVHLTAAHWHSLVGEWSQAGVTPAALAGVRMVNVTGDALSAHKLKQWEALKPAGTGLVNTYGPTEITVSCSAAYVRYQAGVSRISIGKPFANTRMYILDAQREPVPLGVAGELYISGAGVARGYLNLPELTAERFLDDPFTPGQRMYKTGDLARWLPCGEVEFIGRNDFQVKVRGFRIELGEVEAKLAQLAGVQEVAVIAREDEPGDKRLVAYVVGAEVDVETLRRHAVQTLPHYMVPAAFVALEALPLTPNGKLDRQALPAPDGLALGGRVHAEPEGEVEQALAAIWAELLKLERVGRHDNFFELGGHSLLAVSLIERMRREGLHADVGLLFTATTLAELAVQLRPGGDEVVVPPNLIPRPAAPANPRQDDLADTSEFEEFRL
ncbi:amino acid adenylation domain-containing protein [Chitinimonas arctica]|uniref:Amino acid adenylation domain-containing protein n=1 Tax=Chitinimonas arctica TaxID=2594795 RepID=A0A516SBE8_9NEIS|nr:non-ribosomal peptide synthetase [Chitinimonas arctica]QDQ25470.1 amino acid adenylation domain-containing protein [Chitinimonas arctica]